MFALNGDHSNGRGNAAAERNVDIRVLAETRSLKLTSNMHISAPHLSPPEPALTAGLSPEYDVQLIVGSQLQDRLKLGAAGGS